MKTEKFIYVKSLNAYRPLNQYRPYKRLTEKIILQAFGIALALLGVFLTFECLEIGFEAMSKIEQYLSVIP